MDNSNDGATVKTVLEYVANEYGTQAEHPFASFPEACALRLGIGKNSQKWYAIILDCKQRSLGLEGDDLVYVLDVKCEPALIDGLVQEPGFFRGYHMNKTHWLSVLLDGSVPMSRVADLIAISRDLVRG